MKKLLISLLLLISSYAIGQQPGVYDFKVENHQMVYTDSKKILKLATGIFAKDTLKVSIYSDRLDMTIVDFKVCTDTIKLDFNKYVEDSYRLIIYYKKEKIKKIFVSTIR